MLAIELIMLITVYQSCFVMWQVVITARLKSNIIQIVLKYILFNCVWFPHNNSKSYPVTQSKKNHDKRNKNQHKIIEDTLAKRAKQHHQHNNDRTLTAKAVVYYQRMLPWVACKSSKCCLQRSTTHMTVDSKESSKDRRKKKIQTIVSK